jgi:replicative DNA helicase
MTDQTKHPRQDRKKRRDQQRELFALEAEKSTLGGLMRDGAEVGTVASILDGPEDFHIYAHQCVYAAILDISAKGGDPSPPAVSNWLNDHGKMIDVRYDYLGELYSAFYGSVQKFAEIVRDKARLRRLRFVAEDILEEIYKSHETADSVIEMAEQKIFEVASNRKIKAPKPVAEVLKDAFERYEKRAKGDLEPGISFGWPTMDVRITLKPERLTIVAARTSVGKSVFAVNVARNVAALGKTVYFSNLEMPNEETIDRALCLDGGVNAMSFESASLTADEYVKLIDAYNRMSEMSIFLQDAEDQTLLQITSDCRRLKARGNLHLVIVDYLQLIRAESKRSSRQEEVAEISRRLKSLSRMLKVPVIALAQINRAGAETEEPQLHHLRDSGAIEQDADNVLILHKPNQNDDLAVEEVVVRIAKQRGGVKGRVTLMHEKATFRLYEAAGAI